MRVAMISEHASPLAAIGGVDAGGQNLHVAELAAALAGLGHDVRVYTRRDAPDLPDEVAMRPGVTVEHVPAGPTEPLPKDDLLPYMRPFGRWLARRWWGGDFAPDVVHAHFWMSGLAALTATDRRDTPVVLTYHALGSVKRRHQGAADTSPADRIALERRLGASVDRVIAQCADEVAELTVLGVPSEALTVIPSGVDVSHFTPEGFAAPRDRARARFLTVGRLVPRKGYDALIRVLGGIPAAELVIAGGPPDGAADPEAGRLRRLAGDCGVADRVRLLGAVPRADMPAWYRSADVLACTPWYEPFGLTPLEGMACGLPVVAYAVGGLAESVLDRRTGRLVPAGDERALAQALRRLLGDEDLRARYGAAAVRRARERYSWERTAAEVSTVYADVVGRRRAPVAEAAQ